MFNLLCLLTLDIPQRKSSTRKKDLPVLCIWFCYYMKNKVWSAKFSCGHSLYMWLSTGSEHLSPFFSCDTCEQSLGCLVKIVVLFWEPDIKLQHNSLQKEWQCPSRATYLQLCRAWTFSQQIWSFLGNLHSKIKKWKGRMPLHCLFSLRSPPCVLILMYT